jgi:hypothetical protein
MSIFTAADWAELAAVHDQFLTDTCRIRPNVAATPGAQGAGQSWPAISATVSCAVLKQSPVSPTGDPDATWLPNGHTLVVPNGTTLAEGYRVEWVEGGKTLDILGTPRRRGTDATAVEADCVEVPS